MRFSRFSEIVFAAGLLFSAASYISTNLAQAQAISVNGGSIQGTIADQSGSVLVGATVTITNKDTGFSKTLQTDTAGLYSLGPLNPGSYEVTVTASGFQKLVVNTSIRTGTATPGSFKLSLGQSSEEILVTTGDVQINTDQAGVSGVISTEQINTLPINGRNFLDLAQLEPGVVLQDGNTFDPTKAGYSALGVNGFSGRTTRILLDGQDITDENVGTTIFNVSEDAISEFQINHSTQDASGELTSTGQVLVSTNSGTNEYHGKSFYIFQDHRAGFATAEAVDTPFQRNQFGGAVGGPILKNKLFFFVEAERIKQEESTAASLNNLLSAIQSEHPSIGSPFRSNYSTARADYNGPLGGRYFARINYDVNRSVSGTNYSLYNNRDNTWGIAFGADFQQGSFTHSFRGSYEKFHNFISDDTKGNASLYDPFPSLAIRWSAKSLATGPNPDAPQVTYQSDKQFRYDGSWTHGRHSVRFGAEINRLLGGGLASFFGLAPRAYITPSSPLVGNDASNPLDYAYNYLYVGNGQGYFSEKAGFGLPAGGQEDWRSAFYIADSWKIASRLLITAALRWNRDTERANQDLAPIPCSDLDTGTFGTSLCSGSSHLLDLFGSGLGNRINQPNKNFGPNVGLLYTPTSDNKTSIRAGFGIYYDSNLWNNILFDRENRLKNGLFNSYSYINCSSPSLAFPGGTVVTSVDGVALSTLCTEPLSTSGQYVVDLQSQYQAAVAAAGAQANPNFVGETLTVNSAFYAPHYVSPYSIQYNVGVQRELKQGVVASADYVHSTTLKIQQTVDVNHVGAARYLNKNAATLAINSVLNQYGVTTIDDAINAGASISDFMSAGLDSGNNYLSGYSSLYYGLTPSSGAAFGGANPNLGTGLFNFPNGKAKYDALELRLQQQSNHPLPGIAHSNFEVSYSLSRISTTSRGGSNSFFTDSPWNYDQPSKIIGDADSDTRHSLSFGGAFQITHGPQIALIGHFRSAPPSNLILDSTGTGNIFQTDVDGDGQVGDLLPGTKPGAFGRSIKAGDLKNVITNYNNKYANTVTPAGQALIDAGLFTLAQLQQIGAVQKPVYAGSTHILANPIYKSIDASLSYPVKLKWLGEKSTLEPKVAFYNLGNFANWSGATGTLINTDDAGSDGSGAATYVNGTNGYELKNENRTQRGTGTFDQGAPRSIEFQLWLNF